MSTRTVCVTDRSETSAMAPPGGTRDDGASLGELRFGACAWRHSPGYRESLRASGMGVGLPAPKR